MVKRKSKKNPEDSEEKPKKKRRVVRPKVKKADKGKKYNGRKKGKYPPKTDAERSRTYREKERPKKEQNRIVEINRLKARNKELEDLLEKTRYNNKVRNRVEE